MGTAPRAPSCPDRGDTAGPRSPPVPGSHSPACGREEDKTAFKSSLFRLSLYFQPEIYSIFLSPSQPGGSRGGEGKNHTHLPPPKKKKLKRKTSNPSFSPSPRIIRGSPGVLRGALALTVLFPGCGCRSITSPPPSPQPGSQ